MKRYEKFVIETSKDVVFDVSEGKNGELIIRIDNKANVYSQDYATPPIPEGYKHIGGQWNSGFIVERISDGSQFVWIPVGILDSNGTLDGVSFNEKFGRRNYMNDEFSESEYHEVLTDELELQIKSVKKYSGFYISRYYISKNKETGNPQSVKGEMPWIKIDFNEAKRVASTIEDKKVVKSHITFGTEFDSVLEWFIQSKARTLSEITKDSTNWGNHWYTKNAPRRLVETGSNEEWCTNGIYDFAGNISEWTQEQAENGLHCVTRGSDYYGFMCVCYPAAERHYTDSDYNQGEVGFRAALWIK